MKKFYLIAIMAVATLTASAQQSVNISTYGGTNMQKYDGTECKVNVNRYIFNGWNTIAMPFEMTETELNETFGSDCKLEKLVAAESDASGMKIFFQDCKAEGIQANTPYILYYTGETGNKNINKTAIVSAGEAAISVNAKGSNEMVTMAAAQQHISGAGLYGVLAVDNSDAKFVAVDETKGGFYATRCFMKLETGNSTSLTTIHLAAGEITGISEIAKTNKRVDVYNISGQKVASGIKAAELNNMQPGIYVVNGQKVLVK
jgi:hypothetical protein